MGFNVTNVGSKSAFRTRIVAKQNLFKRFKKRHNTCKNPTEARFCKNECVRIAKDLKVMAKAWKKMGFGKTGWITKSCKVTGFKNVVKSSRTTRKNKSWSARRTSRKTYARRNSRKSFRKSNVRRTRKNYSRKVRGTRTYSSRKVRSTKARRSYSWR
jgi:hypothetical protein